jgi:O-acetyl-ADP-ribose deacetylase (regulator of RNase III)
MVEPSFKLVLADPNGGLCEKWREDFEPYLDVEVHEGRFEDVDFDCVVSPANSFGLMDGGVDEAITMYFGQQMMDRVQTRIKSRFAGEQPVGTSTVVMGTEPSTEEVRNTDKKQYVAHTPTMMIPMDIGKTTNVYMAMKAMLLEVEKHNSSYPTGQIKTVVCPGLGTGAGRVSFDSASKQMLNAYNNVYNPPEVLDWEFAVSRYNNVITNR